MTRLPRNAARNVGAALVAGIALMAAAVTSSVLRAAPEPDPVPKRWQLDLEMGDLHVATLEVDGSPRKYFYLTYKVVNNSGEDLLFAPMFELGTDEGEVRRSGRDVPLSVTKSLIVRQDNPFLEDQISIIDQLLQGPENAKEGMVIWPVTDLDVDEVVVYAAGFSGETKTVIRPDTDEAEILRKVYMCRYAIGGTIEGKGTEPIVADSCRWIMR